jgi:hypothetical protein
MSSRIFTTNARLDDAVQMAAFLLPIPNGQELAKVLRQGQAVSSRAYDDESWTARFVVSDGVRVTCFGVTDITIDQAEMIAATSIGSAEWNEVGFRETVALALGPTFDPAI